MGRGRGKGGCECCEAIHAFACCLCLVLLGGPILIGIGATLLTAATRDYRGKNIAAVDAAVGRWEDPNSPTGWQQYGKLSVYAVLNPGQGVDPASGCSREEVAMRVDTLSADRYVDEGGRFQNVKQLRFLHELSYRRYVTCRYQVTLRQQPPGASSNSTLAALPMPPATGTQSYTIQLDRAVGPRSCPTRRDSCYGSTFQNCRYNCVDFFGGAFNCRNGDYTCELEDAYISDISVKVTDRGGANLSYTPDTATPGIGGGGNVMPAGFVRQYTPSNGTLTAGPLFQLFNIRPAPRGMPSIFSITLRSSADPYLAYMQTTGGSGYLGTPKKSLVASGVVLVVLGVLGSMCWMVTAFYAYRMLCARQRPRERPVDMVGGYAWDMANRYGGQYAPAVGVPVHGTGTDGMPTAQPLYYPAPGQPAYSHTADQFGQAPGYPAPGPGFPHHPPPGGAYPPGAYPPYGGAYTQHHPPPGASVEMGAYPYPYQQQQLQQQQPPYPQQPPSYSHLSYPAPGGPPPPDAGATAGYSYPTYYSPHDQQQPAAAGAPSAGYPTAAAAPAAGARAAPAPPTAAPSGDYGHGHSADAGLSASLLTGAGSSSGPGK